MTHVRGVQGRNGCAPSHAVQGNRVKVGNGRHRIGQHVSAVLSLPGGAGGNHGGSVFVIRFRPADVQLVACARIGEAIGEGRIVQPCRRAGQVHDIVIGCCRVCAVNCGCCMAECAAADGDDIVVGPDLAFAAVYGTAFDRASRDGDGVVVGIVAQAAAAGDMDIIAFDRAAGDDDGVVVGIAGQVICKAGAIAAVYMLMADRTVKNGEGVEVCILAGLAAADLVYVIVVFDIIDLRGTALDGNCIMVCRILSAESAVNPYRSGTVVEENFILVCFAGVSDCAVDAGDIAAGDGHFVLEYIALAASTISAKGPLYDSAIDIDFIIAYISICKWAPNAAYCSCRRDGKFDIGTVQTKSLRLLVIINRFCLSATYSRRRMRHRRSGRSLPRFGAQQGSQRKHRRP